MGVSNGGGGGGGGGSAAITGSNMGTIASRPTASASPPGSMYWSTDTNELWINNAAQTTWLAISQIDGTNGVIRAGGSGSFQQGIAIISGGPSTGTQRGWIGTTTNAADACGIAANTEVIIQAGGGGSISNQIKGNNFVTIANASLNINSANRGIQVAEGPNCKQGLCAAMTSGSVTVSNVTVTANSRIFVCRGPGGTNPGAWYVSAITAGTSFVITSTNAADTGTGFFEIFEPA